MKIEFTDNQREQLDAIDNADQKIAVAVYFLRNHAAKTWSEVDSLSEADRKWLKSKNITMTDIKRELNLSSPIPMGRVALIGLAVLLGVSGYLYLRRRKEAPTSAPAPTPAPLPTSVRPARRRR